MNFPSGHSYILSTSSLLKIPHICILLAIACMYREGLGMLSVVDNKIPLSLMISRLILVLKATLSYNIIIIVSTDTKCQ